MSIFKADETSNIVQDIVNLTIHDISILTKDGKKYQIFPKATNFVYESLSLVEGMFEASVSGKLIIRDINSLSEQINFDSFDDLLIKIESPDIENSYKSLKFKIYNVQTTSEQIKPNLIDQQSTISPILVEIEFVSYEHYLLNYKEFEPIAGLTGADIITKIASEKDDEQVGLVNYLNQKYFKTGKDKSTTQKEMDIEPTYNWVWYKQNQLLYPWAKLNKPIRVTQLLNYLADNSVSKENPFACNFLFWQDLDKWNFKSIEKLLTTNNNIKVFTSSSFPTKTGNIYELKIITESNFLRLFESNALSGKYYLVEPKWDHPYREMVDYNESHSVKEIVYDYFKDYDKWKKVEKYPLVDTKIKTEPSISNVILDNISGYFEPSYSNRKNNVAWEHYGNTYSNRDGNLTWQPAFDQTDLSGETCRIIQKEIKQIIKQKKEEYARKRNLKEKWKVYRCSVCCDDTFSNEEGITSAQSGGFFSTSYGVVAAGAFTDLVNYDAGLTGPTGAFLPVGFTLSYDFSKSPFSDTLGDVLHLTENPEVKTKYLFDLEIVRIDFAREIMLRQIEKTQKILDKFNSYPICPPICSDPNNPFGNVCFDSIQGNYPCGGPIFGAQCDPNIPDQPPPQLPDKCFCTATQKQNEINIIRKQLENVTQLYNSRYWNDVKQIVLDEKNKFLETYEKYKNRRAFFISKEIGFTADNLKANLLNVKKITRMPIRGSKYEKLAHKEVVKEFYSGLSGASLSNISFKGFPTGATQYYPYEVFYDNDNTINPREKHPYYDSGYNFDVGFNASTQYSYFQENGGPIAGNPQFLENYGHGLQGFYCVFRLLKNTTRRTKTWKPSQNPNDNPCIGSFENSTNSYSRRLERYRHSNLLNDLTTQNLIIKEVDDEVKRLLLAYDNDPDVTITRTGSNTIRYFKRTPVITYNGQGGTCQGLGFNEEEINWSYSFSKFWTDNKGINPELPPGVVFISPMGGERLPNFDIIEWLNAKNFIDVEPVQDEPIKKPTENILEELESYVRIEFKRPIGIATGIEFPQGFYDTPGSEYYLPYHILLTPGPFGTKSVDYNISVIGQDPFGFDVAVRRIRKPKKQNLNLDKKALVNFKDYHILDPYYNNPLTSGGPTRSAGYTYLVSNDHLSDSYLSPCPTYGTLNQLFSPSSVVGGIASITPFPGNPKYFTEYSRDQSPDNISNQGNVVERIDSWLKSSIKEPRNPSYASKSKEFYYYDIIYRATRKNPLALPNSYFELSTVRTRGIQIESRTVYDNDYIANMWTNDPVSTPYFFGQVTNNDGGSYEINILPDNAEPIYAFMHPGNVFMWTSYPEEIFPVDTDYFKSFVGYNPTERPTCSAKPPYADIGALRYSYFEFDIRDRNERENNTPQEEKVFYGLYTGTCIWRHPLIDPNIISDEEIQKAVRDSVWKNDISGDTEYGLVSPQLEDEISVFDRNFAAQFIVIANQQVFEPGIDPCAGYPCSNPNLTTQSNVGCPQDDPVCNCPCQELRPDKLLVGITGPEPTYIEIKNLEKEIKECDLIKEKLGEDWIGCVWTDPLNPLNCSCPCIGEKFLEYLRYNQTYCTFWETPAERPLLRNAQMMQIRANQIIIKVNGDLTLRPGMKVYVDYGEKRYSGLWLVSKIVHDFGKTKHYMNVTLIRDSEYKNPKTRAKELVLNTDNT